MKKVFLIVVLGLVLSGCAKQYWTYDVDNLTCAQWHDLRKDSFGAAELEELKTNSNLADSERLIEEIRNSWWKGLASTAGHYGSKFVHSTHHSASYDLTKSDAKRLELWADYYCKKYPHRIVKDAAIDLVEQQISDVDMLFDLADLLISISR